ncbi:acyl-CoA dehydrogenase family protein [Paraburkholderia xenovorans]|uniref:acyl-CoA dehydrogenase family protein n=1 Tax=Paraburkholderia xenovorans TaxID=36873 RepID=UPI0038BA3F57
MQFEWTAEQRAIRTRFEALGKRLAQHASDAAEKAPGPFAWQAFSAERLWHILIPAAHGGDSLGWWEFAAAFEGLASEIRSTALMMSVASQAGFIYALLSYGSEEQQKKYFHRLLSGAVSATAISERVTGTNFQSLQTRLTTDADGYTLSGSKYNISNAPTADVILVIAKLTEQTKEHVALVLLDQGAAGLSCAAPDSKLGNADLPTGAMTFESIGIARENILGPISAGARNLMEIASIMRIFFALATACVITPYLRSALHFASVRQGRSLPLNAHQYVQKKLVDIKIGLERTKWLSYAGLSQLLAKNPEALVTCSIAKIVGAEDISNGALELLKLYGSDGYQTGEISRFVTDALGFLSAGGTEEMHRNSIFGQLTRIAKAA